MNRQQALDKLRLMQAWHEDFGNGPCPDYDAICYAINIIEEAPDGLDTLIKALEAEHKKLIELQSKVGTNLAEVGTDYISRQVAIDALNEVVKDHSITDFDAIASILDLPPAQPAPCEDAVSRKAVKDGFVEMCSLICPYTEKQRHTMCGSCLLGTAFDVLEATQPVTPKQRTGKWIPHQSKYGEDGECVYTCDKCGENIGFRKKNFCPNCGAKMTEGEVE